MNTTSISPTGKITPATTLASPTSATPCIATSLAAPPNAINAPAISPSKIIFGRESIDFVTPDFDTSDAISAGELNLLSIKKPSSISLSIVAKFTAIRQ